MALFISEEDLKNNSLINGNVDDKLIKPTIQTVQDLYIKQLLGSNLYDEINTQIAGNSLTVLNTTLLNTYIIPCIIWYVMAEAPINLTFKFMNKGVMKRSSENSFSAEYSDLIDLSNRYKSRAEEYATMLRNYLIEYNEDYPLFYDWGDGVDKIRPKSNIYNTGLYLGEDFETKSSLTYDKKNQIQISRTRGDCSC